MTSQSPQPPRIAIIGSGLAGLAAAVRLVKIIEMAEYWQDIKSLKISLYESRRTLGGRAGAFIDSQTGESLDLCQHVGMGCCTEFLRFIRTVNAEPDFRRDREIFFIGPNGEQSILTGTKFLPAPLHLTRGLMGLKHFSFSEKSQIARTLLHLWLFKSGKDDGHTTFGDYLKARNVSPRLCELFWTPIVVSALSETIERASFAAARKVFVDGFLTQRDGYELIVPRRPIGEIIETKIFPWLSDHGVKVHRGKTVKRVAGNAAGITGIELQSGEQVTAANVIAVVPWTSVGELFDAELIAALPEIEQLKNLQATPIASVHLWYDRQLMTMPHVVLPGRLSQWLFDSSTNNEHCYQVVISAAGDVMQMEREQIIATVDRELREAMPAARDAVLQRSQVIFQTRAVFAPLPGHEKFRPAAKSSVPGLFFAGDWTATGWPATMESAVRSGNNAANEFNELFDQEYI